MESLVFVFLYAYEFVCLFVVWKVTFLVLFLLVCWCLYSDTITFLSRSLLLFLINKFICLFTCLWYLVYLLSFFVMFTKSFCSCCLYLWSEELKLFLAAAVIDVVIKPFCLGFRSDLNSVYPPGKLKQKVKTENSGITRERHFSIKVKMENWFLVIIS